MPLYKWKVTWKYDYSPINYRFFFKQNIEAFLKLESWRTFFSTVLVSLNENPDILESEINSKIFHEIKMGSVLS